MAAGSASIRALAAMTLCLAPLALLCSGKPRHPFTLGAYATNLTDRTPNQRHNARLAAATINGVVVRPHGVFSFNRLLRGWTRDKGYRLAPVSYDGVLTDDYGGGVCQTSTTLYNAALLAGLPILERHPHTFAPGYAPPGRDAGVAYENVDLRFRNPYSWPVTIHARSEGALLVCRIEGQHPPRQRVTLSSQILDRFEPPLAPAAFGGTRYRTRWRLEGRPGLRVVIDRHFYSGGQEARRERISDDTYQPLSIPPG